MSKIVPLSLELVPYAVQLAEELHRLGTFRDIAFEHDTTTKRMRDIISDPSWFFMLAKDDNDVVCGAMCGCVDSFFFSRQLLANEHALYVREGTPMRAKIASMLVRAFIKWAYDVHNVTHVQTGDVASINSVGVDILYRRLGFQRFGVIYKYSRSGGVV